MNEKKKLRRLPKRILSFVLTLAMVLTLMPGMGVTVKAETIPNVEIEGLIYSLDDSNNTATITGVGTGASTTLNISAVTYNGTEYTVTAIGERAFYNTSVVSATFPEVITIGTSAFNGSNLTTINLPKVTSIGEYAFAASKITSVDFPEAITIEAYAFDYCRGLTSVSVPNVTTIKPYGFEACGMTTINFPKVTTVGGRAFAFCNDVIEVNLPLAADFGEYAFYSCDKLTTVTLDSVTEVSSHMFYDCKMLETVTMSSATIIGDNAFEDCYSLTTVNMPNATSIGNNSFIDCIALTSVSFPKVRAIGDNAFAPDDKTSSLAEISFPELISIGENSFAGCGALTSVSLPKVTTIGTYAFGSCATFEIASYSPLTINVTGGMTSIDMPEVKRIGDYAFNGCLNLESINMPKVEQIGEQSFALCNKIANITFPNSLQIIGSQAFMTNAMFPGTGLSTATIKFSSVATVADDTFTGITGAALTLPLDWPENDRPDADGNWKGGSFSTRQYEHAHNWKYTVGTGIDANVITAKCEGAGDCTVIGGNNPGVSLTLSASSANYSGSETYSASLSDTSAWTGAGLAVPTIKYYKATSEGGTEGTEEVTDLNGLAAGNYYAAVTVGTATAKAAFKVIPPHTHNGITFDKPLTLTDIKSQGIEAGNYYLTEDLELTSFIYINNKIVNLCLNGHVLKAASGTNVIRIQNGGELNLYDCGTTEHYFTVGDNGLWTLTGGKTDATETVVGGVITGGDENNWSGGGAISVSGQYLSKKSTLNMYGGNIVGNSSIMFGGGVHVNGVFHMKGGTIQGNVAPNGAGVNVEDDSVFNLTNGEIKNNCVSTGNGGGVKYNGYDDNSFIVGGSAKICDNKRGSGETATDNNVYLFSDYITLGTGTGEGGNGVAVPTEGMSIGVTTKAGTGQFTSNGTENDVKYFTPDNDAYEVEYNASGYLQLVIPQEASHTTHDDIEFQPWVPAEHDGALLPNVAGSWYLTDNVTVNTDWNVPEGTTNLCLNGKMLSLSGCRIKISESATLNLYDCGNDAHEGYLDKYLWTRGTGGEGTTAKTITGGIIYPEYYGEWNQKAYYPIQVDGTFTMYGGTIAGVTDTQGWGFSAAVTSITAGKGHFNMYGGAITGNAYTNGMYFANHNLNYGIIDPGKLESFTVGKNAVIDENYVIGYELVGGVSTPVYAKGNVIISDTKVIKIATGDNAPASGMKIGVKSATAPTKTKPVAFTEANAQAYIDRFESNMPDMHIEVRNKNALYLCVADEAPYVPHECVDYKEKQNGQAATCTEDGWNDYYKCTTCETLYSDEAMTNEITDLAAWKIGDGKIEKTGHDWTYSANENVVTATCKNNAAHTATLTLTAASQTYTNIAVEASFEDTSAWTSFGLELPTIAYEAKTGSSLTDGNAINAGSYTAKASVTIGGQTYTATKDFEISKATLPTELAVSLTGWTYGETNNDPSVTGNVGNGAATYTYKVKGTDDSTYTETKPVNAGSYTVRASIAETTNYEAATVEADFTIDKADMVVGTNLLAPSVPIPLVYDGNAQELLCAGQTWDEKDDTTSFGTFYYSVDGTSWSTDLPTAINAGEYNPVWYFVGDENHNNIGSAEEPITQLYPIEIARGDQTVATVVMDGYTYGGTLPEPSISITPSENATVTYYYSATNTTTGGTEWKDMTATTLDAGTYYLYAVIAATDNFGSQTTAAVAFTIAQKEIEIDWAEVDFTYDGTDQTSKITASYKDIGGESHNLVVAVKQSSTVTAFKNAGTYTAEVTDFAGADTGSKNYALPETKTQTYTMNTKALTATVSATKVYDGTAAATADQVTATVATGITGETLTISGVTGTFNSANVADCATVTPDGTNMTVTAVEVSTLAANYTVSLPESGTGSITAFDLSTATVTVDPNGYDYTGSEVKPTPTVTFDTAGKLAIPTDDYTLSYENNTNAAASTLETGAPTVTVEPADSNTNVTGSKSVKFTILKVDQPAAVADTASVTTGKSVALESNISGKKESPAVTYAIDGTDLGCTVDASTGLFTAGTEAGDVKVNVTFAATTNYKETVKTITVTVSLRTEVAVSGVSMVYPGEQSNYVYGDTVTKTGTPSAKIAGTETPVTSGIDSWTYTYYKNTGTAEAPNWTSLGDTAPSAAGSYKLVVSVPEANEDYIGSSEDIPFTIAKKVITITPNANQKKNYGENDPAFSYQNTALCGEDTLSGALSRAVGETYDASGYAFALGTLAVDPAANAGNYTLTLAEDAPVFMIEKKVITVSDIIVADKVYDGKTDGVVITGYTLNGKKTEDTMTLTGITGTYASANVNAAQAVTLNDSSEWALEDAGTAKDNYVLATTGQPTTAIGKITKAAQKAPTAPSVSGETVTIAAADREKKLEYCVDDNKADNEKAWISVPTLNGNGTFTLSGLAAGNHTVYLRVKESSNYNASASVSSTFTLTQYSVAYNANGGVGSIASQTANSGSSVTVKSGSGMSRTGYTFAGWKDENGTSHAVGSTVGSGMTLYAQWVANTYTVKFNANGGTGTMADQSFTYDTAQALTDNAFERTDYTFVGWATSANGPVLYSDNGDKTDKQLVKNLAGSGTVTLYAIWAQNVYSIKVNIESPQDGKVQIKLQQGNAVYAVQNNIDMNENSGKYTGYYVFSGVPAGTYNIVVEQNVDGKNVTMTQLVVLNANSTANIDLPESGVNSKLEVEEDTLPTVVGGLDEEAESNRQSGKDITVTMTVEKKEEQELAATASEQDKATQDAISEIKATANGKTLDFMNIEVEKTTTDLGTSTSTTEAITETSSVLELVFSYEMNGKKNIQIYRQHGDEVQTFEKLDTKPTTGYEDGKFYVDTANSLIYVYAKQFSTYAIGYEQQSSGGGSGGSSSYAITVNDAKNGTVSTDKKTASAGQTVTITVTPDKGFTLETLTVLDKNGKEVEVKNLGNGKYTFKMPSGKVAVSATFMEDNTMLNFFVDVKATDYFYDAVLWAAENGITNGTDATHFSPFVPVTRAQVVTFLWRTAGCPEPTSDASKFADVEIGSYYEKAVAWAIEQVITKGTSDTTFSPDKVCTRGQIVTFLARFAGVKDEATGYTHGFTDVKATDYFNNAVAWAKDNKVTEGTSATTFSPNVDCTRAQVVTFLYRWMVK